MKLDFVGVRDGECVGCGAARADGLPPLLHRPDCPTTRFLSRPEANLAALKELVRDRPANESVIVAGTTAAAVQQHVAEPMRQLKLLSPAGQGWRLMGRRCHLFDMEQDIDPVTGVGVVFLDRFIVDHAYGAAETRGFVQLLLDHLQCPGAQLMLWSGDLVGAEDVLSVLTGPRPAAVRW